MSRYDELIAELCPDGVEYKQLWQVTTWDKRFNGVDRAKQPAINPHHYYLAKELQPVLAEQGNIKVLTTSPTSLYTADGLVDESHIKNGEIVAIPWGGNAVVQYYKGRYITSDNRIAVVNTESIMTKFLFYVLKSREEELSSYYRGAGIKHPEMSKVLGMEIPVPPIEVQREAVDILDAFAGLTDTLTEELDCRRQQYAHYRDEVIHNCSSIKWLPLSEISENCNRARKPIKKDQRIVGCTPYYGASGIVDYVDGFTHDGDYLLISEDGANLLARSTPIAFQISGRNWINNHAHVLRIDNAQLRLLIEIYLNSISLEPYISKGAQPKLTKQKLETIEVPVPSKSDLSRIADILGCFDALTTSLTDGLPAEIEARKAQYAHYRDRLLDFPRREVAAS